jgi:hypothetical protein
MFGCLNDSRVDKIPLLLLLAIAILEDAKGQETKATNPSLTQLLRYDDGTPTPLLFNLYVVFTKFCKRIDCLSLLQVFGKL